MAVCWCAINIIQCLQSIQAKTTYFFAFQHVDCTKNYAINPCGDNIRWYKWNRSIFCFVNKANNKLARCTQRGNHVSNYTHVRREINTEFSKGKKSRKGEVFLPSPQKSGVQRLKFLRVGRCRFYNIHIHTKMCYIIPVSVNSIHF